MNKFKQIWRYIKLVLNDEPIHSWRTLSNGKYMCDGDCGRWSLHGVCTCGLAHYFKYHVRRDLIERDNVSWHRERQTEQVMMRVEFENECPHGISWNNHCHQCRFETNKAMANLLQELNKRHEDPSIPGE